MNQATRIVLAVVLLTGTLLAQGGAGDPMFHGQNAYTLGDGAGATIVQTNNVTGTDTTITYGNGTVNVSAGLQVGGTAVLTAETNALETDGASGILDTEVYIGTGAGTGNYAAISGDATLANTGALTLAATITRDAEWDTAAEINTATTDDDFVTLTGVQTLSTGTKTVTSKFDFGGGTVEVPNSTTLPGTCTVGDSFMDTDAAVNQKWYLCVSTNTWEVQAGSGSNPLSISSPAAVTLTAGGNATLTGGADTLTLHTIDTDGAISQQNWVSTTCTAGSLHLVRAANTTRTVTIQHWGAPDFSMDNTADYAYLICSATDTIQELARASGGV